MDASNDIYFVKQGVVLLSLNYVVERLFKFPKQKEDG